MWLSSLSASKIFIKSPFLIFYINNRNKLLKVRHSKCKIPNYLVQLILFYLKYFPLSCISDLHFDVLLLNLNQMGAEKVNMSF